MITWSGIRTEALAANADLLAVGLICDTVDFLEVVRVGDDLVVGEDVLW
jgi:acyl dehydratase